MAGNAVGGVSIVRVYDNLVVPDLTTQLYKLRRIGDDFADLCPGLFRCSRCVYTNDPVSPIVRSKSDNHATLCRAGNDADNDVVEREGEFRFLRAYLFGKPDIAEAAEFMN